jgi:8-oxo-dGTP diphosphatase
MEDAQVYVGQKAFIEKNGKILGVQDSATLLWDFPGGKIKWEESLEKSLKREVTKEVGLDVEVGEPFHTWKYEVVEKNSRSFGKRILLIGVKCKYLSGNVKLSSEHSDFEWITNKNLGRVRYSREWLKALNKYFLDG